MKNLYTVIAFALIVFLALIPPIDFFFKNPFNDKWFLLVVICGFSGFYTLFLKIHPIVKVIAVGSFVECFFSVAPFVSFTSYISIIICCYFYFVCTKIDNWDPIFKMLQTILFLNVFFMFMQSIGKDVLLNYDSKQVTQFGIIGQHMQMASFGVVISALLISFSTLNFSFPFLIVIFCNSTWTVLSAGVGLSIYIMSKSLKFSLIFISIVLCVFVLLGIKHNKFTANTDITGRLPVWVETVKFANQRPFFGWGAGTYKFIFPQISSFHSSGQYRNVVYKNSHNFICQMLFEVGYPMTLFILGSIGYLIYIVIQTDQVLLLSGIAMIVSDALVHFPDREIQCVLLIILFLAHCERTIRIYGYELFKTSTC